MYIEIMYNETNIYDIHNEKNIIGGLFFICFGICCLIICCSDKMCGNKK